MLPTHEIGAIPFVQRLQRLTLVRILINIDRFILALMYFDSCFASATFRLNYKWSKKSYLISLINLFFLHTRTSIESISKMNPFSYISSVFWPQPDNSHMPPPPPPLVSLFSSSSTARVIHYSISNHRLLLFF